MISMDEALARALALMTPTGIESAPLAEAAGRVLAAPVSAARPQPPFAASSMDGYAVRAAEAPGPWTVIGEIPAGASLDRVLAAGEAARIFTGAPTPEGADAVLIQEEAAREGDAITATAPVAAGDNIRPAGLDFPIGGRIDAPRRLSPADIALAAAMNAPWLEVRRKPIIHLIPTGDELVFPGEAPSPTQIISSNNFGLAALIEAAGGAPILQPVAGDTVEALTAALDRAAEADLIITLGGASVGDYDLVRQAFGAEGLDLSFYKVAMRPGKPLMAGRVRGKPVIGLPGNPVSSMVLGRLLIQPCIEAMLGLEAGSPQRQMARLGQATAANGPREHFMRARLEWVDGALVAFPFPNQDSSILSVLAAANGLAVLPPKAPARQAGDPIDVIPLW